MAIEKVIVLDDELVIRKSLSQVLQRRNIAVAQAESLAKAKELIDRDDFDLIFADVRLPDGVGIELLDYCRARPQRPMVVIMTGYASVESAVECMRNGAFDYVIKPFSNDQVDILIKKATEFSRLVRVNQHLTQEDPQESGVKILGNSPAIRNLQSLIRKVARTQATVLIQGESGTGKELVARSIYRNSPRAEQPFITVNCAAVPDNLVESEFFGHEKGAFTGAVSRREGRFELAHGGTILLDEISEISPVVQSKLLRVLQERELERVGGTRTIKVDVRVIATTNRDLALSVERKEFRQDLYFRLNVVPIIVPPLRERKEDILMLADNFMSRYARKHGCKVCGFSEESRQLLAHHDWPGNVRELQNVVERAVILSQEGGLIEPDSLGLTTMSRGIVIPMSDASATPLPSPPLSHETDSASPNNRIEPPESSEGIIPLSEVEKHHIFAALKAFGDNRTKTAKHLGISIRTLRNKLNEYQQADSP